MSLSVKYVYVFLCIAINDNGGGELEGGDNFWNNHLPLKNINRRSCK